METINDLKEYLEDMIYFLESSYDGSEKIRFECSTYFVGDKFLAFGSQGFIDLNNPADTVDDEY